jgi:hypothetical protein
MENEGERLVPEATVGGMASGLAEVLLLGSTTDP